jgi:hypothetical protein
MVSGFSLNPSKGLGILPKPLILSTFKPFFIDTNLPKSAKMGDVIPIQVAVHNYLDQSTRVTVELDDTNNDFDIITNGRQFNEHDNYDDDYELKNNNENVINIFPDNVKSTTFTIKLKNTGPVPIKV